MQPLVYIADLRHTSAGALSTDCMPLGVAYIKAVMDRDLPEVRSRLFAYPESLLAAMQEAPPDVLMCSNYLWNETLSLHFFQIAKRLNPNALTIFGGPNIHLEPERQIRYVERNPEVDVYILGEGEFAATEAVRHYVDCGMDLRAFQAREVLSSVMRRDDGSVTRQEMWKRHAGVDEIPSPWLTGIQDHFFDGRLAPMIETNRGCPFKCTFCVQGVDWYTKVHYFDLDRLKEELDYIAARIHERSPAMTMLRIADSNYGMFERDVEISEHIGKLQRQYNWPRFIDVTTGKNRPERVIKSIEAASGAPVLYMAVQSLDEDVLRKIKRQNIKLDAYGQLQMYMRGRGLRTNSDLILSLPGESIQTHVAAINKLLDQRIDQMHNLQLLLLKGSELETEESRSMFQFDARYRLGPKNYGVYGGEEVFDIEEIVVATDTLSFDDYLLSRKLHLMCSLFWNDSWFEDAFRFTDQFGLRRSEVFHRLLPEMEANDGAMGELLKSFLRETNEELFPSPEALRAVYSQPEHFARLQRGEVGENLMYKYRAQGSFLVWPELCALAMNAFKKILLEHDALTRVPDFEGFWQDFARYLQHKHAHGPNPAALAVPVDAELQYDFESWVRAGHPLDVDAFRLARPARFHFAMTEEGIEGLRAAFAVWSEKIQGLAKLVTRIQLSWQVRECTAAEELTFAARSEQGTLQV